MLPTPWAMCLIPQSKFMSNESSDQSADENESGLDLSSLNFGPAWARDDKESKSLKKFKDRGDRDEVAVDKVAVVDKVVVADRAEAVDRVEEIAVIIAVVAVEISVEAEADVVVLMIVALSAPKWNLPQVSH